MSTGVGVGVGVGLGVSVGACVSECVIACVRGCFEKAWAMPAAADIDPDTCLHTHNLFNDCVEKAWAKPKFGGLKNCCGKAWATPDMINGNGDLVSTLLEHGFRTATFNQHQWQHILQV